MIGLAIPSLKGVLFQVNHLCVPKKGILEIFCAHVPFHEAPKAKPRNHLLLRHLAPHYLKSEQQLVISHLPGPSLPPPAT